MWLAIQIQNSASTFQMTFGSPSDVLSPGAGTPEERAANLKLILTGPGGLASTADDMRGKTNELMTKLILDAQKKWGDIATTTQQFSQNSLASYDFSTQFGSKIAVNQ